MEQDIFEEWGEEANTSSTTANNTNNSSQSNPNNSNNNGDRKNRDMPPHQDSDLGEAPDYPAIYFVYNYETQKLEVRDRRGKIKQEIPILTINGTNGESAYTLWLKDHQGSIVDFMESLKGANGKNGKNAYEEWKEWQGPDADVSLEAYWNYFKGENGKSAFELWKEVHGEKVGSTPDDFFEYLKGQNGKDAFEVWQDLGYKNSTREDFFKWIASLVKTQKGEDGKVFYPHFDGFTIYFTEDLEGKGTHIAEKDIRGKDGRTFEPVFNGTELHFDDKEGHKTDPVDLRGKDAFELWKEYHHKPDAKYEEFEEYFKGQNVTAKHSYLNIKDFTCPVQTIDTNLIANVLDSGTSPDKLVQLRQEDIDKLRNEGNKRREIIIKGVKVPYFFLNGSYIYENWAGWFKEFSWWCAGADRGLLRMCPGDHSKYTGIGTVILFTALMAWFSSFIAMLLVLGVRDEYLLSLDIEKTSAAAGFATFWGLMIFFLDRFITNTMYSDGKVSISKDEFFGGLPRILIAIFLGIVISAPLELRIFKTSIEQQIVVDRQKETEVFEIDCRRKAYLSLSNHIHNLKNTIDRDSVSIEKFETELSKLKDDYPKQSDYKTNRNNYNGDGNGNWVFAGQTEVNDVKAYNEAIKIWNEKHPEYNNTNKLKIALRDKREKDKLKLDSLTKNLNDTITKIVKHESEKFVCKQDTGLLRRLSTLHSLAMNGYVPLFSSEQTNIDSTTVNVYTDSLSTTSAALNIFKQSNYELFDWGLKISLSLICFVILFFVFGARLSMEKKNLFIISAAFIVGIFVGCNYELIHSLLYYLSTPIGLIMLLFILIDISPVLYKMMLADGVYDNYLHQEKLLAQDKIRLSLARMLRNIEKGELKSLSPFIMGKMYRKLMKFSTSKDGLYNGQDKDYKQHIQWENAGGLNDDIKKTNKEVFDVVLDYKKRIILASYAAWYRDMRDAMIGKKDDEEGSKITPNAQLHEKDTQQEHTDNNEEAKNDSETQQNDGTNNGSESSSQENSSDEK